MLEIYLHIAADNTLAAERFLVQAERTVAQIGSMPGIGKPAALPSGPLRSTRSLPVAGYPNYLVFYATFNEMVTIVRVVHAARDLAHLVDEFQ